MKKLIVQDTLVSLTDIARVRNPDESKDVVKNWLRNRATVEYLGLWEKNPPNNPLEISPLVGASLLAKMFVKFASKLAPTMCFGTNGLSGINNAAFKGVEFDTFRHQAGSNSFTLSPNKWIEATGTLGINPNNPLGCHSGVGRNPVIKNTPRITSDLTVFVLSRMASSSISGQNHNAAPLTWGIINHLDSGLRRNDAVFANGFLDLLVKASCSLKALNELAITQLRSLLGLNIAGKLK